MCSDHVTSAAGPASAPSHHPGPGYVANPRASDVELDGQLRDAAARWLNVVPSEHRRDTPQSRKSALQTLEEHMRSCREHPLRALWVAHRHLQDPSTPVRVAALVLASEALWWLGHFQDAEIAAQTALEADPESGQARWRLAVALYRLGKFGEVARHLDVLLQSASQFAPGWALRGQAKVWLAPKNTEAGRADFESAAALEPGKWVVPFRLGRGSFRAEVDTEIARFDSEMGHSSGDPDVGIELLPAESVGEGKDPDIRWEVDNSQGPVSANPFSPLGGEFAVQTRAQVAYGTRFILYQRNIENLCKDKAALTGEIRKSVAELYKEALHGDKAVSYKGAPEYHAEGEDVPDGESG
jgi:tetratricopeptide (TPR) repeat protein